MMSKFLDEIRYERFSEEIKNNALYHYDWFIFSPDFKEKYKNLSNIDLVYLNTNFRTYRQSKDIIQKLENKFKKIKSIGDKELKFRLPKENEVKEIIEAVYQETSNQFYNLGGILIDYSIWLSEERKEGRILYSKQYHHKNQCLRECIATDIAYTFLIGELK